MAKEKRKIWYVMKLHKGATFTPPGEALGEVLQIMEWLPSRKAVLISDSNGNLLILAGDDLRQVVDEQRELTRQDTGEMMPLIPESEWRRGFIARVMDLLTLLVNLAMAAFQYYRLTR